MSWGSFVGGLAVGFVLGGAYIAFMFLAGPRDLYRPR